MSPDPRSHVDATLAPPPPALSPGTSFAQYVAATADTPQPAWRTLNAARESAFTGEIRLESTPPTRVYVDAGVVYFAERSGDEPIARLLVAEGVVTTRQLSRGTMRVGDVEHLGRLFDRDPSIDRDAVLRLVESTTGAIIAELAASSVASVTVTAYRHHPSGIHRWFVAPYGLHRPGPLSDVAQLDRSVIDDLPGITRRPPELRIEWDEPTLSGDISLADHDDPFGSTPGDDRLGDDDISAELGDDHTSAELGDVDISAELERFDADRADWSSPIPDGDEVAPPTPATTGETDPSHWIPEPAPEQQERSDWLDDFRIVWPDGTHEPALPAGVGAHRPSPAPDLEAGDDGPSAVEMLPEPTTGTTGSFAAPSGPPPSSMESGSGLPAPAATEHAEPGDLARPESIETPVESPQAVHFDVPTLVVDGAPRPESQVPEDVADAVRRALRAIETAAATTQPVSLAQIDPEPVSVADSDASTASAAAPTSDAAESPMSDASDVSESAPSIPATPVPSAPAVDVSEATHPLRAPSPIRVEPPISAPVVESASGFAPPAPDTSAEAIYARAAAAAESAPVVESTSDSATGEPAVVADPVEAETSPTDTGTQNPGNEPGRASVVFVDDAAENEPSSRTGALRRLIGSLRKSA